MAIKTSTPTGSSKWRWCTDKD